MDIEALVDPIIDQIKTIGDMRKMAPQMEEALGRLESQGHDADALDDAWKYFIGRLLKMLPADLEVIEEMSPSLAESGLRDNYFDVAMASLVARDQIEELPVIAWAAFNKNQYQGWKDEIAVVRTLIAGGFDPNLADSSGNTPLHYMAFWNHPPVTSSRGIRLLLENGADPNAQNKNGDTPLCYMAGSSVWNEALTRSAAYLLYKGADPHIPASDGATAIGLLKQAESASPNPDRAALIAAIEKGVFDEQ